MDLLDLLKLMVRRWYVAVPILVVALGGALLVGSSIEPEYKTSAAILLVPPTTQPAAPAPSAAPAPGNPWLQVGEASMAQAIKISVTTREARDKVVTAGGDQAYEVDLVTRSSILTIDVTTTTPERASTTVHAVIELVRAEVAARQAQYKPRPGEEITTQVLDPGDNVQPSRSNVLRAQIVVGAIGLLLAAAGAVGFDAVQHRRAAARLNGFGGGGRASATVSVVRHRQPSQPAGALRKPDENGALAGAASAVGAADNASPAAPTAGSGPAAGSPAAPGPATANGDSGVARQPIAPVFVQQPRADDTVVISSLRTPANDDK